MEICYFNGKYIPRDDVRISPDDRGFLFAEGIYEVVRWYEGYFYDMDFCESEIDSVLHFYRKGHIVVGHTPNETTTSLFNNKILGADAGIMYDKPGEMLFYKNGSFYKCFCTGSRIKL